MIRRGLILLAFAAAFAPPAQAKEPVEQEIKKLENLDPAKVKQRELTMLEQMLKFHARVLNGWYVEERCQLLSEPMRISWNEDILYAENNFKKRFGVKDEEFTRMRATLAPAVEKSIENAGCGDKVGNMVIDAVAEARQHRVRFDVLEQKLAKFAPTRTNQEAN